MTTIKIILRKEEKQDGTFPLAIRITKDRKTSYVYLNYSINPKDWDEKSQCVKKSHPNSSRLNNYLRSCLAKATDSALEVQTKRADATVKAVRQKIKPSASATFFTQAQEYLNNLQKSGKFNRFSADKPRIGHFKEFLKNEDLAFSDLTPGLLEKFVIFLKSYHLGKKNKKAMSERTVVNHLAVIRSVFAHARKNKVVTKEQSPFGGDDGIKIVFPDTTKVGLSVEDVEKMEQAELHEHRHDHARNLWLISFYFAGMRISDILRLKWSDFNNGRLHYVMGKNDKGGSLKIPDKAINILEKYKQFKQNDDDLVFPDLKGVDFNDKFKVQKTIAVKNRAINLILQDNVASIANLNGIPKMHKARHTFGGLAGDAIPIQMLQKLYRHTHVSTTIGYQGSFIHKEADDALDAVISQTSSKKPTQE